MANVTSVDITIFISGIPEDSSGTLGTTTSSTTTTQETTGELGVRILIDRSSYPSDSNWIFNKKEEKT